MVGITHLPLCRQRCVRGNLHQRCICDQILAQIPTVKCVALSGRCGQVVILIVGYLNRLLSGKNAFSGLQSHGVLICFPARRDRHIVCRHRLRNLRTPALEGVAGLRGIRNGADRRAEIAGDGSNRRSTHRIKGNGVLVDRPLRLQRHILCGHRRRNRNAFTILVHPTAEGIAGLCRVRRGGHTCSVILRDRVDRISAVGVKGNRVLIDLPLRVDRRIACRHRRRNVQIPTVKGVSFSFRICRCRHRRTVILRDRINGRIPGVSKGNGILVDLPLRNNRQIVRGHRVRKRRLPAHECIALSARICRNGYLCTVIHGMRENNAATVGIITNHILIDSPRFLQRHVLCRHGRKHINLFIVGIYPSVKAMSGLLPCGSDYRRTIILGKFRNNLTIFIQKGDLVLIDLPLRGDNHILRRDRGRNLLVPAVEGISFLHGICRCRHRGIIHIGNRRDHRSSVGDKGDRIRVDRPLCFNSQILCRHRSRNRHRVLLCIHPTAEGISGLCGFRRCRHARAVKVYLLTALAVFGSPTPTECITVSGIVILHHQTSVRQNRYFLCCRRGKPCVTFHTGSYCRVSGSGQVFRLNQIILFTVKQILLIMLYLIRCIRICFPVRSIHTVADTSCCNLFCVVLLRRAHASGHNHLGPSEEGIAGSRRGRQSNLIVLYRVGDRFNSISTGNIKGDGIGNNLPICLQGQSIQRHRFRQLNRGIRVRIHPAVEFITSLCRVFRQCQSGLEILRN